MKSLASVFCLIICIFGMSSTQLLLSQEISRNELDTRAIHSFENGDLLGAIEDLENLHQMFPKDPRYCYYLGTAYLRSGVNHEKSVSLLRHAASRNYSVDVHMHLAQAYLKTYRIEDAQISLENFRNLANRRQMKKQDFAFWERAIAEMSEELSLMNKSKLLATETISIELVENVYVGHINGKVITTPEKFIQDAPQQNSPEKYMYLPKEIQPGEKLYFSRLSQKGKSENDIYSVTRLNGDNYTMPKGVGNKVNSSRSEAFPYFDKESQTLYFSSNRIGSLGGYDIYKSLLDTVSMSFGHPERLGFPINTPFDDFLYIPKGNSNEIVFISNRNENPNSHVVYKLEISAEVETLKKGHFEEALAASLFRRSLEEQLAEEAPTQLSPARKKEITPYEEALSKALTSQLISDSILAFSRAERNKLRATNDMNSRRVLVASITELESVLQKKQAKTDSLFLIAQQLQKDNPLEVSENNAIAPDKQENGITRYRYQLDSKPEAAISPAISTKAENNMLEFSIAEESPYSDANPIPLASDVPEGLVYRIQLGAYSQQIPMNSFGGLTPMSAEIIPEKDVTKYYVGYFASSKAAREALNQVKDYGFKDAFVVPYYNKEKIAISKARELEFSKKD